MEALKQKELQIQNQIFPERDVSVFHVRPLFYLLTLTYFIFDNLLTSFDCVNIIASKCVRWTDIREIREWNWATVTFTNNRWVSAFLKKHSNFRHCFNFRCVLYIHF